MAITVPQSHNYQYQDVKVLYVEDELFTREKLLRVLNRRFSEVHFAIDGEQGFLLYKRHLPDLIIADIKMNQMNSLAMIEKVRSHNEKVQIIVTTAHDDNDIFIQSLENNVNHFILKPIDLEQFLLAIQKSVYQIQLNKRLSNIDPVTKCMNRFKFEEVLSSEISRSERYSRPFSIILLEVDYIRKVNTYLGHQKGDVVLSTISTIVQQRIRESDIFARWGGEEFILLTPETNRQGACVLAESILSLINSFAFPDIGTITCSFGIAEFSAGKKKTDLILEAEEALYTSKQMGSNCVTVFPIEGVVKKC
ncbi:diguanylate cyclase [Bacillus sp. OK048]|uniref:GGDEF domain-containing protein n=1 Tax=Bacillus sp. OK048 TaxID=1882761 RepID=UPI0008915EA8|nr:diguanylate cyclase [Bacillus sp. OK048]SDN29823.1 response regulator receiver modulated diguanylate cyclase [Bacillus sp. OK048]